MVVTLWRYTIGYTSQSRTRLYVFGAGLLGFSVVLGNMFSSMTAAPQSLNEVKQSVRDMPLDAQRTAHAQQQRLSNMIKDMVEDKGTNHWNAAMSGTLVPHPKAENKTIGAENERLAKLSGLASK